MKLSETLPRFVAFAVVSFLSPAAGGVAASASAPVQEGWAEISVVSVERLGHSTQLLLDLHNSEDGLRSNPGLGDPAFSAAAESLANDLAGVRLLDEAANREYLPLRDVETRVCICSQVGQVEADATHRLWWRSASLPDGVEAVTVLAPDGRELAGDVEVEG